MTKATMNNATTEMLNSTSLTSIGGIALTPVERSLGRLMRAPDHSAAGGAGDGGNAGAGDAGDGSNAAAAAGSDAAGDTASAAGGNDGGDAGDGQSDASAGSVADGGDDAGSLIGDAGVTKDAAGAVDKGAAADEGDKDKDDAAAVPETYELEPLKIGEGDDAVEVTIDQQLLTDVTPQLKEAGVTKEQAQKLAPLAMKIEERVRTHLNDEFRATTADWAKEAKADPEIGGKNWDATMGDVAKALDHFGAPSEMKEVDGKQVETNPFRVFLNQTGFGNHPELIRMFAKIGKAAGEDGALPRGDKGAPQKKDRAALLYPNDVPKA